MKQLTVMCPKVSALNYLLPKLGAKACPSLVHTLHLGTFRSSPVKSSARSSSPLYVMMCYREGVKNGYFFYAFPFSVPQDHCTYRIKAIRATPNIKYDATPFLRIVLASARWHFYLQRGGGAVHRHCNVHWWASHCTNNRGDHSEIRIQHLC